jgi:hypothetical protein
MKSEINPELNVGDRIICYHMDGEHSTVSMGTEGTVTHISNDPFERDVKLINVKWDNGSTLSLISNIDTWKKVNPKNIREDNTANFFSKNPEVFDNFKYRFLRQYLLNVRESGIVNMFGAAPLLYSGKEHIERYYGENPPNQEAFDEVLEKADDAKNEMIGGTIKYLEENNIEVSVDNVNRHIKKLAQKVLEFYMNFY